MTAATSVPDGELWASFPEATQNDILGLLNMLLERWAARAGREWHQLIELCSLAGALAVLLPAPSRHLW